MARHVIGAPLARVTGYALKPVMLLFGSVISKASDAQVQADLARLPRLLDRADALVDEGTIGGVAPNAADLQILTSIRLLLAHEDLRPAIAARPAAQAALHLIPAYPRAGADALPPIPGGLPPQWLVTVTRRAPAPPAFTRSDTAISRR
jgi:hypothetical protein